MAFTHIDGIGNLSQVAFNIYSDGINYEKMPGKNNHNESFVEIQFNRNDWFNDDTELNFSCDNKTCELSVAMNSEVQTPLYNNGSFYLSYDRALRKWSMEAYKAGEVDKSEVHKSQEWYFCSPDVSVKQVASILRYLAQDDEKSCGSDCTDIKQKGLNGDLRDIATSIENSSVAIVQSANVFMGETCFAEPPPRPDPYGDRDSPVPAYGGG